jgi:hypothetical protein
LSEDKIKIVNVSVSSLGVKTKTKTFYLDGTADVDTALDGAVDVQSGQS